MIKVICTLLFVIVASNVPAQERLVLGAGASFGVPSAKISVSSTLGSQKFILGLGTGVQFDKDSIYANADGRPGTHEKLYHISSNSIFVNMQASYGTEHFYFGIEYGLSFYQSQKYGSPYQLEYSKDVRFQYGLSAAYIPDWWGVKIDYDIDRKFGAEVLFAF